MDIVKNQSEKENVFLALPYMHPVCPMHVAHGRIFVVADVYRRYFEEEGRSVIMPVASHFSGNTAERVLPELADLESRTRSLFLDTYGVDESTVDGFSEPIEILEHFEQEALEELRHMRIGFDENRYYNTTSEEYGTFVRGVFDELYAKGLVVPSTEGGDTIDYANERHKEEALEQVARTAFYTRRWGHVVRDALTNLDNGWSFERQSGIGISYNGFIIDPMFDSELYTVFDSYVHTGEQRQVDVFFSEEHLKNWLAKKVFAEFALVPEPLRTEGVYLLGIGTVNKKRMSSSSGNTVLVKDLIDRGDGRSARLCQLLLGNPLENFDWSQDQLKPAQRIVRRFDSFVESLPASDDSRYERIYAAADREIEHHLDTGDLRKAAIEALQILPRDARNLPDRGSGLKERLQRYGRIFLGDE